MEEKLNVFDFTSNQIDLKTFELVKKKPIKEYLTSSNLFGKIVVVITNIEDETYYCVYSYKSNEDIYEMIENSLSLSIKGIYIKDFKFNEIKNFKNIILKDFKAPYCFWDGNNSFEYAIFNNDVIFRDCIFGNGDFSFDFARFDTRVVSFSDVSICCKQLSFNYSTLCGNIHFIETILTNTKLNFTATLFKEVRMMFNHCNFGKSDVYFELCNFMGNGELDFSNSNFIDATFMMRRTKLGNHTITFQSAVAKSILFLDTYFSDNVDMRFDSILSLSIDDCIIEKTFKCDIKKIQRLSFLNTINLGQIFINWNKNISTGKRISNNVLLICIKEMHS